LLEAAEAVALKGKTGEFRQLLSYARPYRARLIAGIVAMAIVGFAEGLVPLMITPAIDSVLNPGKSDSRVPLVKLPFHGPTIYLNSFVPHSIHNVGTIFALCLIVVFIVKAVSEYLGSVEIQFVGLAAITDLRNQIYEKLVRQPIGFFQKQATGRLISGVINDVERARGVLSETVAQGFRYIFTLFFLVMVLLIADWKMAMWSAVFVPIVLLPVRTLGRRIRNSVESSQSRLGELTQILQETFAGNRVVKAFGMERFEIERFHLSAHRLLRENMRWIRALMITPPLMDILSAFVVVPVLLYARSEINHGVMTVGLFFTFVFALFKAYEPIKGLGNVYQQFEQAHGATAQVFSFLALQEEVQEHAGARPLPLFSRQVEFDNVTFGYDADTPILRGISLDARAGEVLAIVGSSGAGKTTLVNLLPRFYDVTSGSLRIDGQDVRVVTLNSLREQMAIVTQETILFHDTVWNNICYGQSNLSKETVEAAARAALAHDFITELPQGYQTLLGERGQRLSGGQRQRLAIARALLKDSPILILDEATSELDSESEMLVQKALANLMVNRTVFVIAHRLSTIRRADKIVVLDDGGVAEVGTHQELLARGGIYARLYDMQFAELDEAPTAASSPASPRES
jgi:subfamily B ATP-binding cassette protein MsbA